MAILATATVRGKKVDRVYIRPQQIGGAKNYDWACTFAIFANQTLSADFANVLETVTVRFPWVDGQDVYADAYKALKESGLIENIEAL